jgi:hypothetical protein
MITFMYKNLMKEPKLASCKIRGPISCMS